MTRSQIALALAAAGTALAVAGVALIHFPASLILAGAAFAAFGLFVLDVDEPKPRRKR